jgi:hypothetical protein
MHKILLSAVALAVAVTILPTSAVIAQDRDPAKVTSIEVASIDCRTLLKMPGDDRENTVLFLHGYVTGSQGKKEINLAALTEATDKIADYCIDHPSASALEVFKMFDK